ncbi:MAG: 1,4-dihydroxy-2-naphthoate octaprenyltransferase [Desulfobacteraceae bacterium 4484_190.2]|nr:MAG: 1,4-dihydroxy-2-naphthoate octaprenyltransferase [Desulfobacteraceae bacterium 4484_190.2]
MNVYIKALRAPFLAGSLIPVIIGAAYGFTDKHFSLLLFLITALGVAALHLAANLLNDYYDAKGSDPINVRLTPFSGGSRVIQNRQVAPWCVLSIAVFFYVLSLSAAIWLVFLGRPLVLAIGLLGVAAGWSYSARPLQLMSRGWGEICIFFAFGPFITLGAYYVMSGSLNWAAFALGFPQGFLITAVIWINQFPDYEADRDAGKKNLVVRLGPKLSRYPYCVIMLAAFIIVIFLIGVVGLTYLTMLSFIAFPLAFKAIKILWNEYLSYEGLIPAQALTIQTLIAHGVLLSLGLVLSRLV